jgi:hypothetical protein
MDIFLGPKINLNLLNEHVTSYIWCVNAICLLNVAKQLPYNQLEDQEGENEKEDKKKKRWKMVT